MKKLLIALLAAGACVGLSVSAPIYAASVNNFTIQDYQIDYYLSKDQTNHSVLQTVETISALFPQADQNHGIERAIPTSYDGHTTHLQLNTVTDAANIPLHYATRTENNNTVVRIGDAGTYVHGLHTYKITYTQHDVTKFFSNTNDDELYWDTNGTGWAVPVQHLAARVHIKGAALRRQLNGKQACYQGAAGATNACTVAVTNDGFSAETANLAPYQNMTLAIGFNPHTFAGYQKSLGERLVALWAAVQIGVSIAAFTVTVYALIRYYKRSNRTSEITTIVPEYLPPPDTSVAVAALMSRKANRAFSAQLIDFAVRHYIKIYQTRAKSWFRPANYQLEIIKDVTTLKEEEQELFRDIFPNPVVGARLDLASLRGDLTVSAKLQDNPTKLSTLVRDKYGLRARNPQQTRWFVRAGKWLLLGAVLTLSPALMAAAIVVFVCALVLHPLTDTGLALVRYLKGLELYITVAETERLRMLQSPEGAAKLPAPIDTNNTRQLIQLYERVLPYAILMNKETEWNKRLGQYYESVKESPSWIGGTNTAFNAVVLSSFISNLTTATAYSVPSSASSGGSSGGGSSGGGGGGGGGGGW